MSQTYMIDELVAEIQVPVSGIFVLSRSFLNGPDLLATTSSGLAWQPLLCDALSVNVHRGGNRDGINTTIDVGTLNMTLKNAADPTDDPNIKPNSLVRLRTLAPVVTGGTWQPAESPQVVESNSFETSLNGWSKGTTLSVFIDTHRPRTGTQVMGIRSLNVPASGSWYAVKPLTGLDVGRTYTASIWFTPWLARYSRYEVPVTAALAVAGIGVGTSETFPEDGDYSIGHDDYRQLVYTFVATSSTHELRLHTTYPDNDPGSASQIIMTDDYKLEAITVWVPTEVDRSDTTIYTGNLVDITTTEDKETGDTYVSLAAVDNVQTLANTTRFGAVNPAAEYETWQRRAERVLQSSNVPYVPPASLTNVTSIAYASSAEAANWSRTWTIGTRDFETVMIPSFVSGSTSRVLTGFQPGRRYLINVRAYSLIGENVRLSLDTGDTIVEPGYSALYTYLLDFLATSTSHTLTVELTNGAGSPEIAYSAYTSSSEASTQVANVVYESSLVNHLTLATNSGRSGWYVDRLNTVRFAASGDIVANFSDVHSEVGTFYQSVFPSGVGGYDGWTTEANVPDDVHVSIDEGTKLNIYCYPDPPSYPIITASREVSGLTVGDTYTVSASLEMWSSEDAGTAALGVDGISSSAPVSLPSTPTLLTYSFTATSNIHYITIEVTGTSVGVSSDAATDFNILSVAVTGVVRDPLHMCYTQIERSYDTRAIVNELVLANHARKEDPDNPGSYLADDANFGPYRDLDSGATYGKRAASIETSLYTGGIYEDFPAIYASIVLSAYSEPEKLITRLTFKGTDNIALSAALDVYDRITVTRKGLSQTSVIIGIEHSVSPTDWYVTLDIMEII